MSDFGVICLEHRSFRGGFGFGRVFEQSWAPGDNERLQRWATCCDDGQACFNLDIYEANFRCPGRGGVVKLHQPDQSKYTDDSDTRFYGRLAHIFMGTKGRVDSEVRS